MASSAAADDPTADDEPASQGSVESLNPLQVRSPDELFEFDVVRWPPMGQLTARGAPEAADWRIAVATLLHELNLPDGAPFLCDVRAVTRFAPSMGRELLELVNTRRVAFVACADAAAPLARQLPSATTGDVQIFTRYETALRWLLFAHDALPPKQGC
jgi:hypothetical protein